MHASLTFLVRRTIKVYGHAFDVSRKALETVAATYATKSQIYSSVMMVACSHKWILVTRDSKAGICKIHHAVMAISREHRKLQGFLVE